MTPIRILPFEPGHAAGLCLRAEASSVLSRLSPLPELARAYAAAGPAWTLAAGDWPLVCGGVVRFWAGVGELWCWTGQEAAQWPVSFARLARRRVDALLDAGAFHRLQAHVREDDEGAQRFARFLGLSLEGRCPGYGPDESTHLIYGRYKRWKA